MLIYVISSYILLFSDSGTSYNVTLEIVAPEPEDREAFEQVIQQQVIADDLLSIKTIYITL